ncbi:hypothetical protein [Croceicoccus bisphenolivorans]|uniref:hypothetical protein n=1 Tax=Croceicoccus bisphenolivorans TaxID=1783232 RepID=UPI00082C4CA7|nr:hypothetical protein [Croceicoccus bisphenolivorans]
MKKISGFFLAVAFALGLAVQPVQAKGDEPLSIKDRGAMDGAAQVAVAAFNVGFIFESTDQTKKTGGMMGAFGGVTKAKSTLVGVTPEMMQAVVDAAYADFMAKLAAQGVAVVPAAELFANEDIRKAADGTGPIETKIQLEKKSSGIATFVKPTALPLQLTLQGDLVEKTGGFAAIGKGFAAGGRQAAIARYVSETGIPLVSVVYLIDFSDQKRPGAFSFGGLKVNANLSVVPEYSKLTVVGVNKQDELVLEQQVSVDGDFIEQADATGGTEKTAQAAANIGAGVAAAKGLGLPMIGKTRKFEFAAKPGNYEEGAAKAAMLANDVVLAGFASLR